MSKKAVEEILAVTALKKLLEVKHLVKTEICLGNDTAGWFLYLTNNGLIEKTDSGEYHKIVVNRDKLINVKLFRLNHKELEQIYEELICHESK